MALSLRLRPDAEDALRIASERSGRSQQDILRAAVDSYLGLVSAAEPKHEWDHLIVSGKVHPPRDAYRKVVPAETLPVSERASSFLDREERF